ncbi:hypothetical protein [Pseudomonas sp. GV071]|uniref:hypothetical protein n=1 Tax=Pseudomonas sp. GV071 TaxID=2135754 RepID=UPI000D393185|nr:hypothetical protein [Pseudomonas sp. GV071]PTQ70398.1 hypothetical protein C8K61_106120 [Pseudomonas sp. GV071]
MSRSGYSDDCENWSLICWRGAVNSALKGKRGQAFLRELAEALDAMPVKRLITEELKADGEFCTLGALGNARGLDMSVIDPDDTETVAFKFGIARAMACEIVFENDDSSSVRIINDDGSIGWRRERPEERWVRMRKWVERNIKQVAA